MIFHRLPLDGAYLIELERMEDDRGFFARAFCMREFEEHGLETRIAQSNLAHTRRRGTIRGMHYQVPPAEETKLVRCIRGAIHDVIVDLREDSPTYMRHHGVRLDQDNRLALYVPRRFAHGYQALSDGAEVLYQVSEFYAPGREQGIRFDDPAVGIEWPEPVTVVSEKDASWPPFARGEGS